MQTKDRSLINGKQTILLTAFFIIFFLTYQMFLNKGPSTGDYLMIRDECTLLYGEDIKKVRTCYDIKVNKVFKSDTLKTQIIFLLIFIPLIFYLGSKFLKTGRHER